MAQHALPPKVQPMVACFGRSTTFWTLVLGPTFLLCAYSTWISSVYGRRGFSLLARENICVFAIPVLAAFLTSTARQDIEPSEPSILEVLAPFSVFVSLFPLGTLGYLYLRRFVAGLRNESDFLTRPEVEGRMSQSRTLVKAEDATDSLRLLCYASESEGPDWPRGVREYHTSFLRWVHGLNASDAEKAPSLILPDNYIDLLILAGLSRYLWEWTVVVSEQYTIGGEGAGPALTRLQLADMAAYEEDLPELARTVLAGTLPRRWRKVCYLCGAVVLPTVVWAGALYLMYVSV